MAIAVIVVLGLAGWAGVGYAAVEKAADDFSSGGFSGSTGNHPWVTDWIEIGESNGPASGAVTVGNSNCSSAPCLNLAGGLTPRGARRSVVASSSSTASLSYRLEFPSGLLGQVRVEASIDGGAPQLLGTHSAGDSGPYTFVLPAFDNLEILFTRPALSLPLLGGVAGIDNVEVLFTAVPATTTTTTTTTTLPITLPSIPLPSLTTTTVTLPTLSTTSTTSTTTTSPTTSPTEPGESAPTTTIADSDPSNDESGAAVPPATGGPPSSGGAVAITGVNPGLAAPTGGRTWAPQTGFLVRFGTDVEDFTLDILISVVLGLFLAVISDRRLGRHTES